MKTVEVQIQQISAWFYDVRVPDDFDVEDLDAVNVYMSTYPDMVKETGEERDGQINCVVKEDAGE